MSPLASDAGLSVLTGKSDYAAVARALQSAGYQGEKMVLLAMTDSPYRPGQQRYCRFAEAHRDERGLSGNGLWHSVEAPRIEQTAGPGRLESDCTGIPGLVGLTPATHLALLGDGSGRPNDPKMQELREAWFNAPDLTIRMKIGEQMQLQAFENVPYWPLGLAQIPAACRPDITGIPDGFPLFWNVRRT